MGIVHINMLIGTTVSAVFLAELRRAIKSNEFELVEQMLLRRGVAAAGASRAGGDAAPAVTSSAAGFDLEQADADGVTLVMYCAMKGKSCLLSAFDMASLVSIGLGLSAIV